MFLYAITVASMEVIPTVVILHTVEVLHTAEEEVGVPGALVGAATEEMDIRPLPPLSTPLIKKPHASYVLNKGLRYTPYDILLFYILDILLLQAWDYFLGQSQLLREKLFLFYLTSNFICDISC